MVERYTSWNPWQAHKKGGAARRLGAFAVAAALVTTLVGAQVSAAYALTEGDASGPAQTLLAADTESDSDPDSGIATLPDLTEEHPVTLQPDEEPAPSDDASSGTQVVYYADPSDPDEPGDADADVEIDPDGVDFGRCCDHPFYGYGLHREEQRKQHRWHH